MDYMARPKAVYRTANYGSFNRPGKVLAVRRYRLIRVAKVANNYLRLERVNGIYDIKRALLHAPVGALAAWLCFNLPAIGTPFFIGFLVYEIAEDWRIKDRGYKDILGFLWGFAVTGAVLGGMAL